MPSMLEGFKSRNDKEAKGPTPEVGKTLHKTLTNEEDSKRFGVLLDSKKDEGVELGVKLQTGTLGGEDIEKLIELRKEHAERMERVSALEKACTKENIELFARNSEKFKGIVEILGVEKASNMIKGSINEVLETSPDDFDGLYQSWDRIESHRNGKMEELNNSILEQCKKFGINQAGYETIYKEQDPIRKQEIIKEKVRESYGGFKRAFDWIGGYAKKDAKELMGREAEISALFAELDQHQNSLGDALGGLTTSNQALLAAFNREILDKPSEPKEENTSFKEVQKELPPNKAEIMSDWETYKSTNSIPALDTLDVIDKDKHITAFKNSQLEKQAKKNPKKEKSFWQRILGGVFGTHFDDQIKNELK